MASLRGTLAVIVIHTALVLSGDFGVLVLGLVSPCIEERRLTMDVREKLVELLQNAKAAMKSENLSCDIARNMFVVDFMIANGVTVQEWISVDDRLPEETGRYLAVKKRIAPDELGGNRTDIVILRFFVDDGFRMPTHIPDWINGEINEEVTHWMPLPSTEGLE